MMKILGESNEEITKCFNKFMLETIWENNVKINDFAKIKGG
jgi:hypothetical protein